MSNEVMTIESIIGSVAPVFERIRVDKTIEFAREQEFALQSIYSNDYARQIALKNPQSVRDAVTNIAAIGISLNPAKKQAYLVPRKGGITLVISYMGLADLAVESGSIRWVKCEVVRQADRLILKGVDKPPVHEFDPFAKDRGDIVGVYCVAKTIDGDYLTDTMQIDEVNAIRDRSDAWQAWIAKKRPCPWVTDYSEMAKKTLVKRASKMWPKTERLDKAVHHLNTDGGEGIDFAAEQAIEPDRPALNVGNILARLDGAESGKEIDAIRKEGLTAASEARDKGAYDRIRAAVLKRRKELGIVIDAEGSSK